MDSLAPNLYMVFTVFAILTINVQKTNYNNQKKTSTTVGGSVYVFDPVQ